MVSARRLPQPYFKITIYTKTLTHVGPLGGIRSIDVTYRHNLPASPVTFTVDSDNRRCDDLTAEGARVIIDYYPDRGATPVRLSGTVSEMEQSGPSQAPVRTFTVRDDFAILNDVLGWPNPTGTILQQGDASVFFTLTGPAEDVLIGMCAPNFARLGLNITVPTSLHRGTSVTITTRMQRLYDRMFPAIDQAGIGVRIVQVGDHLELQVYEPTTNPVELTEMSGVIKDPDFHIVAPVATRALVGAGGAEGLARPFRLYIDDAAEALWGIKAEVFVDANDIDPNDVDLSPADFEAAMLTRGQEALAENAATSSVAITANETDRFRFGQTFFIGDRETVKSSTGALLTDYVREVHAAYTPRTGAVVEPAIGDWQDSKDVKLYKLVSLALKGIRDVRSSR